VIVGPHLRGPASLMRVSSVTGKRHRAWPTRYDCKRFHGAPMTGVVVKPRGAISLSRHLRKPVAFPPTKASAQGARVQMLSSCEKNGQANAPESKEYALNTQRSRPSLFLAPTRNILYGVNGKARDN